MIEKANLEVFAETLLELAKKDKDIIVVTSDSRGSGKLTSFGKELPDQIIEVGIACLLYTSPSPRDQRGSRMPSSA